MKILDDFGVLLKSWIKSAHEALDIRDFFVFGGLAMLGYGLYLLYPWLAFTVVGAVMFLIGLFAGRKP